MDWAAKNLWLVPVLPLLAAGLSSLAKRPNRTFAAGLAIGSMSGALLLSVGAFAAALSHTGTAQVRQVINFRWFQLGEGWVRLGWVLDPLTAVMLVMVCLVGLLIFIYSVGYMAQDENFTRFFCFLSLFAAAMLGLVIANSLLLFFICWELVGLTSYLLIGFWYHKPSAAAAAKKAFITTRIGDLAFLLGIVWLYAQGGTLLFYDDGQGCMEPSVLAGLATKVTASGIAVSTGIALLIFCGAVGKSGQLPLHVWLPDAMEGPTPVSALIHAATMVAAGVFLVARVYPLMALTATGAHGPATALVVITWVGALTAVFAASIAVAQTDIKRILAYSTVSQLGFMMIGLGVGGVAVGMFHLLTHAFFKALLFMGAGSVIHGCHEEQDVRRMGGLRKFMPITFATYAVGMMALSGVPFLFSGFWSKDEILHAAHGWSLTRWPFYLCVIGAFLTAFYMTRQMCFVFFGNCRLALGKTTSSEQRTVTHAGALAKEHPHVELSSQPHESPGTMVGPLMVLAFFAVVLGFFGTPAWPWLQRFLEGEPAGFDTAALSDPALLSVMVTSIIVALLGIGLGYWLYGRQPLESQQLDVLERWWPNVFTLLRRKYYVDEIYEWAFVGLNAWWARACAWLDQWVWEGIVQLLAALVLGIAWVDRVLDEQVVNRGFDETCRGISGGGGLLSRFQNGRVQNYLRALGLAVVVLVLLLIWGCRAS
jgi:NADH-quinone oxidoreductase subunit L